MEGTLWAEYSGACRIMPVWHNVAGGLPVKACITAVGVRDEIMLQQGKI